MPIGLRWCWASDRAILVALRICRFAHAFPFEAHLPLRHPNTARAWHDARAGFIGFIAYELARAPGSVCTSACFSLTHSSRYIAHRNRVATYMRYVYQLTWISRVVFASCGVCDFFLCSLLTCLLQVDYGQTGICVCVCVCGVCVCVFKWKGSDLLSSSLPDIFDSQVKEIWVHLYVSFL